MPYKRLRSRYPGFMPVIPSGKERCHHLYIKVIQNPAKIRENWNDSGNRADTCTRFHFRPSHVLRGIGIEFFLAARGAEIIFLPFVLARELCRLLINGHFADRVDCHFFITYDPSSSLPVYTL